MWKQLVVVPAAFLFAYWFVQDDKLHTLKGKRVLVTGSSDGIGEQLAYHYARLGANVVITARREERLNKVVKACQTLSTSPTSKFVAVPADMSNLGDTKRVIEETVKHLGGLDILVLNHMTGVKFYHFTGNPEHLEDLHTKMDVNFRSYIHLASHALPELTANEGSIIVVNSVGGKIPHPVLSTYCASKFALDGFFSSLRNQFIAEGRNVSITSCYLGYIGTDTAKALVKGDPDRLLVKLYVPASPNDTALAIIKGGARGATEVYSPFIDTWPMVLLHGIWPAQIQYLSRTLAVAIAGLD